MLAIHAQSTSEFVVGRWMSASNLSLEMADGNRDSQAFIVSSAIIPRPFWVGSINVEIEFVGAVDKTPYLKVSGN